MEQKNTAWERDKEQLQHYRRRTPAITPLYRIVSSCREDFERSWEDLFQHEYGALRHEVLDALDAYLNCGILAHGCARAACEDPDCNHSTLIAYSCKRRGICPACDAKRAVLFAENLVEHVLLPFDHHHVVFTVPKRIRPFFLHNRALMQHLYHAAWESWKELILEQCPTGTPGAVLALHSAGDLIAFHPHSHGLFLAGAILPDGIFQALSIDAQRLQELFADKVLAALRDEPSLKDVFTQDIVDNMKSWEHSGFNVFIGEPIPHHDHERLLFAARYLKKCPVSNERLSIIELPGEDARVQYAAYKNGEKQVRSFTPLEFLAELQCSIPDTWEQTTRWLGIYSSRARGAAAEKLACAQAIEAAAVGSSLGSAPLPEPVQKSSATWARLIKQVFEVDPLKCPRCGASMKIKGHLSNPNEIARITKNLGLQSQRAPPPLRYSLPLAA